MLWGTSALWIVLALMGTGVVACVWLLSFLGSLLLLRCAKRTTSNRLFGIGVANLLPALAAMGANVFLGVDWLGGNEIASLVAGIIMFLLNSAFAPRAWRRPMREYADQECRKCGYLLIGLQGTACPECGETSHFSVQRWAPPGEPTESRFPIARIKE